MEKVNASNNDVAKSNTPYNFVSRASVTKQFPTWEEAFKFVQDTIADKQRDEFVTQMSVNYSAVQYRYDRTTGERTDEILRPALWAASVSLNVGDANEADYMW